MDSKWCIQTICADPELARRYRAEFESPDKHYYLLSARSIEEARRNFLRAEPSVILFDIAGRQADSHIDSLEATVGTLSEAAPVVVVSAPERQSELAFLIISGAADFVARSGNYVTIAAGLVERRIRLAAATGSMQGVPGEQSRGDFGELLRHEVNNPLTGILGNAEMLLARKDRLPSAVIERVETIAELAVRLRETVRRLSHTWDERHDQVGSA